MMHPHAHSVIATARSSHDDLLVGFLVRDDDGRIIGAAHTFWTPDADAWSRCPWDAAASAVRQARCHLGVRTCHVAPH